MLYFALRSPWNWRRDLPRRVRCEKRLPARGAQRIRGLSNRIGYGAQGLLGSENHDLQNHQRQGERTSQ